VTREEYFLAREWLATVSGYREELKRRISVEQKRRYKIQQRIDNQANRNGDIDKLGREIEGCG